MLIGEGQILAGVDKAADEIEWGQKSRQNCRRMNGSAMQPPARLVADL
jgi:hypothetical protein